MRFLLLSLILILTFAAVPAFGQYYMWDADEDGVALEYFRGDEGDIEINGFGLTVKSAPHSGVYLAYAKAREPHGMEVKAYALGYERYVTARTHADFYPTAIASIGISNTDLPYDLSVTSLTSGVALGYVFPVGKTGKNVSSAGLSISMPIKSSAGLHPEVLTTAIFSSTQSFRLSPKLILSGGVAYSITLNEDTENTFEFKIGLMFATKKSDRK